MPSSAATATKLSSADAAKSPPKPPIKPPHIPSNPDNVHHDEAAAIKPGFAADAATDPPPAMSTTATAPPAFPPGFEEYILAQKNLIATPAGANKENADASYKQDPNLVALNDGNDEEVFVDGLGEGLDGLASQWGKLSLKQDIEGGTFAFNSDRVEPTGRDGQPLEFFLLGTVRAVESFNPRSVEKTMLGAWAPRKTMEMTVIDENLYLFRFTYRLDINRAIREAPWRFQEYCLALQEVPRGYVIPRENLVMVPFWIQLFGVPALWQREDVARFIGNLLGTVHDFDPKVRRHTGGGEPFLRVKVEVNTAVELVRGTTVVLGDSGVPIALKYERLFKFCYYCGLVDHVLEECEETLKPDFNRADCKYGEWLKGIPPRSSPWHADNWKPLDVNISNPFAQKKQAIPPGFRALPASARPAYLPAPQIRQPAPVQNNFKAPIVFSATRQESASNSASKRRSFKGLRNGGQELKKAEESSSTSKRRRGEENSSHDDDSS